MVIFFSPFAAQLLFFSFFFTDFNLILNSAKCSFKKLLPLLCRIDSSYAQLKMI